MQSETEETIVEVEDEQVEDKSLNSPSPNKKKKNLVLRYRNQMILNHSRRRQNLKQQILMAMN